MLAIIIHEDEYNLGVKACKHHLNDRIILSKGITPLTMASLRLKILELWASLGKSGVTSLGKEFFEFLFSSLEDVN